MFSETALRKIWFDAWIAQALKRNQEEAARWEERKSQWIEDAKWAIATGNPIPGKPRPPSEALNVIILPSGDGELKWGPNLVADPTCELPPAPPKKENPPGVAQVLENYGSLWTCGPLDTLLAGEVTLYKGKKLIKVISKTPFGVSHYYQEVTP